MTYPDDELTGELRGLGNDIGTAIDMACETVHDHPALAAKALDGDDEGIRSLCDEVRVEHSMTIPVNGDLLTMVVREAVNRVETGGGE